MWHATAEHAAAIDNAARLTAVGARLAGLGGVNVAGKLAKNEGENEPDPVPEQGDDGDNAK